MPDSLKARPVVPVALAYAAGCALALWSSATPLPAAVAGFIGASAAVAAFVRGYRGWAVLLAAMALLGFGRAALARLPGPEDPSRHAGRRGQLVVEGWAASEPELGGSRAAFTLRAERIIAGGRELPADGYVQVVLPVSGHRVSALPDYGQRIRVGGWLRRPSGPREPGGFSYRAHLARQGVFCVLHAGGPASLKLLTSRAGSPLTAAALRVRRALRGLFAGRLPERGNK